MKQTERSLTQELKKLGKLLIVDVPFIFYQRVDGRFAFAFLINEERKMTKSKQVLIKILRHKGFRVDLYKKDNLNNLNLTSLNPRPIR